MAPAWGGKRCLSSVGAYPTLTLMKFIPLSLATALASRVFPVPGAPYSRTPERWRIGSLENKMGYWKRAEMVGFTLNPGGTDRCKSNII